MRIPRPRVQGCVVFLYMLIGFRSESKNGVTLNLDRTSMHPVVRAIGKVLRLMGISSPENSMPKRETPSDPPSWKTAKASGEKPDKASS